MVNLPSWIPDCDSHSPALLDSFLSSDAIICSTMACEFCEWFQVGIDVYIPHRKYQVKPQSSPWFSATCAAAIVYRNHFFRLYQKEGYQAGY